VSACKKKNPSVLVQHMKAGWDENAAEIYVANVKQREHVHGPNLSWGATGSLVTTCLRIQMDGSQNLNMEGAEEENWQ